MSDPRSVPNSRVQNVLAALDLNAPEETGGSLSKECHELHASEIAQAIKVRDTMSLLHGMGHATEIDVGKAEAQLHQTTRSSADVKELAEWAKPAISEIDKRLEQSRLNMEQMRQDLLQLRVLSTRNENARANPTSQILRVPREDGVLPPGSFPKILGEIGSMDARELTECITFYKKEVPHPVMERRRELCRILGAPVDWLHDLQRGGSHG
jgi:hypothetical protein